LANPAAANRELLAERAMSIFCFKR